MVRCRCGTWTNNGLTCINCESESIFDSHIENSSPEEEEELESTDDEEEED